MMFTSRPSTPLHMTRRESAPVIPGRESAPVIPGASHTTALDPGDVHGDKIQTTTTSTPTDTRHRRASVNSQDTCPLYMTRRQKAALEAGISGEDEDSPDFISRPTRRFKQLHRSVSQYSARDEIKDSTNPAEPDPLDNYSVRFLSDGLSFGSLIQLGTDSFKKKKPRDITDYTPYSACIPEVKESEASISTGDGSPEVLPSGETVYSAGLRQRRYIKTLDASRRRRSRVPHSDKLGDEDYLEDLKRHRRDAFFLKEQLHAAARDDAVDKMRVLCDFLDTNNYNVCENIMLGDQHHETALAVAVVKGSTDSAMVLINFGGEELINKPYTTKQYAGVTTLHLAIVKQNIKLVECMLEALDDDNRNKLINSKACGKYFKDKYTCPWVPLSLAVGVGDIEIFNVLLRYGADLMATDDETGDTILHNLARVSLKVPNKAIQILRLVLWSPDVIKWWAKNVTDDGEGPAPVLLRKRNAAGYTPMSYAVCLGANQFATAILGVIDIYTFPQWNVGPEQANLYEVSEIDPAVSSCRRKAPSVLEMYTFGVSDSNLDFGRVPHIYHTMQMKWKVYRSWFIAFFIYHLLVMICFTIYSFHSDIPSVFLHLVMLHNNSTDNSTNFTQLIFDDDRQVLTWKNYAIQVLEIFLLVSALVYFVSEIYDVKLTYENIVRSRAPARVTHRHTVWLATQFDILRLFLFGFALSVPLLFALRLYQSPWQDIFYAIAAISGWMFMLFFVRALRNIGIFTAMMYRMITRELAYFILLFIIGLMSHATAMHTLFSLTPNRAPPRSVYSFPETCFTLFKVIVGLDEFVILEDEKGNPQVRSPGTVKFALALFVLFCHILLLNMLIAAMNNTYTQLSARKEILWLQQRTKAILLIERRLLPCFRPNHNLEPDQNDDEGGEMLKQRKPVKLWYLACEETEKDHPLTNFRYDDDVLSDG